MNDDRQLAIPGVTMPATSATVARVPRRSRAVHFNAAVKGERRPVRVTIDVGMVTFRPKGSHRPLALDFQTWVGIGYWHAAKIAACEAKSERASRRRARRVGGAA